MLIPILYTYFLLTHIEFKRENANGTDSSSSSVWVGKEVQKKPFHSMSSNIYGNNLVRSLAQFNTKN